MAVKIDLASGAVTEAEWAMFLVGAVMNAAVLEKHPFPDSVRDAGIPEKGWNCAVMLEETLPQIFAGICSEISSTPAAWFSLFTTDSPHRDPLPGSWGSKLASFQKLLIVRVLREEKVRVRCCVCLCMRIVL